MDDATALPLESPDARRGAPFRGRSPARAGALSRDRRCCGRSCSLRDCGHDFQNVFLNLSSIARRVVQVAIMEVVHVPIVLNGGVAAARAVFVIVVGMRGRMVRLHDGN